MGAPGSVRASDIEPDITCFTPRQQEALVAVFQRNYMMVAEQVDAEIRKHPAFRRAGFRRAAVVVGLFLMLAGALWVTRYEYIPHNNSYHRINRWTGESLSCGGDSCAPVATEAKP